MFKCCTRSTSSLCSTPGSVPVLSPRSPVFTDALNSTVAASLPIFRGQPTYNATDVAPTSQPAWTDGKTGLSKTGSRSVDILRANKKAARLEARKNMPNSDACLASADKTEAVACRVRKVGPSVK